jgi:hypothetical protein
VSEREEKRATDTWDCEGAGVHLVVAHRERERDRESWWSGFMIRVGWVNGSSPVRKRKGFLKLISIFQ